MVDGSERPLLDVKGGRLARLSVPNCYSTDDL